MVMQKRERKCKWCNIPKNEASAFFLANFDFFTNTTGANNWVAASIRQDTDWKMTDTHCEKRKIGVFIKHVRLHISQKFTSSLGIKPGKNKFRSCLKIRANKNVHNAIEVAFWSVLEPYFMKLTKSFGWGDDICSVFISILNLWATTVKKSTGKKS